MTVYTVALTMCSTEDVQHIGGTGCVDSFSFSIFRHMTYCSRSVATPSGYAMSKIYLSLDNELTDDDEKCMQEMSSSAELAWMASGACVPDFF
jgi:hypothetical protein